MNDIQTFLARANELLKSGKRSDKSAALKELAKAKNVLDAVYATIEGELRS